MSAANRGWGNPPIARSKIVDVRAGSTNVNFLPGVHEAVAPLVVELVSRIEKVTGEAPVKGWCWGYAPRYIGGTTVWSNHAWGLAIDYNAPNHPLGVKDTWVEYEDDIRRVSKELGFRWGGDYSRPDDMHFEFMGTPQDAERIIRNLGQEEEMLKVGDSGNAVKLYQQALMWWARFAANKITKDTKPDENGNVWERALFYGADGDFGETTAGMVRQYQSAAQIDRTGSIGGITASLLGRYMKPERIGHNHDGRYAPKDHGEHGDIEVVGLTVDAAKELFSELEHGHDIVLK